MKTDRNWHLASFRFMCEHSCMKGNAKNLVCRARYSSFDLDVDE